MKSEIKEITKSILKFLSNRLFIIFIIIGVTFYSLVMVLFDIQIVSGSEHKASAETVTYQNTIDIAAPRGEIYDRHGRPLAVNETAFTVKIDPTINYFMPFEMAYPIVQIMERNEEKLIDSLPISKTEPFEFEFNGSLSRERRWKKDMNDIPEGATAEEAFALLREFFKVPEEVSNTEARKALNISNMAYLERYNLNQITIAVNVKDGTVAALEEHRQDFPGFYVDVDYLRVYPQGENFSQMLGYIRKISTEELEAMPEDSGYKSWSIVGQAGLEKAFEKELKGKNGVKIVQKDSDGMIVSNSVVSEPEQGNKITLTIDVYLQNKAEEILRQMLKQVLINKLKGISAKEDPITPKELFISLIKANNLSINDIMAAPEESYSYRIKSYVNDYFTVEKSDKNYDAKLKQFICDGIDSNNIPMGYILLSMYEQNIITLTKEQIEQHAKNNNKILETIIEKIESDEITPQMTNLDPSTGSVVMVGVNTGEIIVAANYPNYDNNQLVNNFNNDYYYKINNDPTTPMLYRAFTEPRAPGSTFKMITAVAALETGSIDTKTIITDKGAFTEANRPYLHCWNRYYPYHGSVNVSGALETSCNYFFAQASYNMGNAKGDDRYEGINKLNDYMLQFGLGARTGSEVDELYDYSAYTSMPENVLKLASPSNKAYIEQSRNSSLTNAEVRWLDGDSIRTAIGQSYNNYTAATMAKYIATLANGGDRYQLHFLDKIESASGGMVKEFKPNIEHHINIAPENLEAIYNGMLNVTQGSRGTAKAVFEDFPMLIGAKTGTAQEESFSHASFAAFAPFDNPQIAVYVMIPNGDTLTTAAPAAQVGRDMIAAYFSLDQEPVMSDMNNTLAR